MGSFHPVSILFYIICLKRLDILEIVKFILGQGNKLRGLRFFFPEVGHLPVRVGFLRGGDRVADLGPDAFPFFSRPVIGPGV